VWFRPNCLGSYRGICEQTKTILGDEFASPISLRPRLLDVFFGPMAKALSIIYQTIKEEGDEAQQLADFWSFLDQWDDVQFDDQSLGNHWTPDNIAVVMFLASDALRTWYTFMRVNHLGEDKDRVVELAHLAASFVVLASKFDRALDQVSATVISLVTGATLADHIDTFIEEFWTTLMTSLEEEMEKGSRPKLLSVITKFGQAMMPFAYPSAFKKTPTASSASNSRDQGRRAASTSSAKMWSGEE